MTKHLFLIHGRSFKPAREILEQNWVDAIEHGLGRDDHEDGLRSFRDLQRTFVYYGDISNAFLEGIGEEYDEAADAADRAECLGRLKRYSRAKFLGKKGRGTTRACLARLRGRKVSPTFSEEWPTRSESRSP